MASPAGPGFKSLLAVLAAASLTSACSEARTGANGRVDFVPEFCGDFFCDLDGALAVDATTGISLMGVGGTDVSGLRLTTSDPAIASVTTELLDRESPYAVLVGNATGFVDLIAVDSTNQAIDYTTIRVAAPTSLELKVFASGGSLDGPHPAEGVDALYRVSAGTAISVETSALADGQPLMGELDYVVETSEAFDEALTFGGFEDLSDGDFDATLPAGEYRVTISTRTARAALHFSAQ